MTEREQLEEIECCGIHCSEKSLREIDEGRVMVFIPAAEMRAISVRHGTVAPHPVIQFVVGCGMAALGYFPIALFVGWVNNAFGMLTMARWLLVPASLGVWLMWTAARRGYFLDVELDGGRKRLAFRPAPTAEDLRQFVVDIESITGIRVRREDQAASSHA